MVGKFFMTRPPYWPCKKLKTRILDGRSLPEVIAVRREALHWVSAAGFELRGEEKDSPCHCLCCRRMQSPTSQPRDVGLSYNPLCDCPLRLWGSGLQSAFVARIGVACLNASAVPLGAEIFWPCLPLPALPDLEFSLLPARAGESDLGAPVREKLASKFGGLVASP